MRHSRLRFCKSLLLSVAVGYSSLFLCATEVQAVSVSINKFRGEWNAATNYRAGDVVAYQSQSYIAYTANRNQTPAAGSGAWYLLAAQGLPGTNGINGTNGTNGAPGIKGDTGPKPVYAYSLVVGQSPAGGDGTGRVLAAPDYTSITAALNAIPANIYDSATSTCDSRYLVKVLPGVYPEQVVMKPCVDLEGSGEATTRISYSDPESPSPTLTGAAESEVRHLTVENIRTISGPALVVQSNANTFKLSHVTVTGKSNSEFATGLYIRGALSDVSVKLTAPQCHGVFSDFGAVILERVTVTLDCPTQARALVALSSSQVTVTNSSLHGATYSMSVSNVASIRIAKSELDGPVLIDTASGASAVCVGSYDGDFAPLTRGCLSPNALP